MPRNMDAESVNGKGLQENGLYLDGNHSNSGNQGNPPKVERRYETFVMTGDMIIKTTAPTKADSKRQAEKRAAEADTKKPPPGSAGKEAKRPNKGSRIPMPSSVRSSPRESPKTPARGLPASPQMSPARGGTPGEAPMSPPSPQTSPVRRIPSPARVPGSPHTSPARVPPPASPQGSPARRIPGSPHTSPAKAVSGVPQYTGGSVDSASTQGSPMSGGSPSHIPYPAQQGRQEGSPSHIPYPAQQGRQEGSPSHIPHPGRQEGSPSHLTHPGRQEGLPQGSPQTGRSPTHTSSHIPSPGSAQGRWEGPPSASPDHHPRPPGPRPMEILGYPRYRDVPMALDIPPDDISSEDEKYKLEGIVNIDDLPPPPDDFLAEYQPPKSPTETKPLAFRPDIEPGAVVRDERLDFLPPGGSTQSPGGSTLPLQPQDTTSGVDNNSDMQTDPGAMSPTDAAFDSLSIHSETNVCPPSEQNVNRVMVVSKSAEKIGGKDKSKVMGVRTSKSHENYLECNSADNVTFVDIDIDLDDNIASSVDALHYEKSQSSLDSLNKTPCTEQSRSLDNSPEKGGKKHSERLMPTFFNAEAPRSIAKLKEGGKLKEFKSEDREIPTGIVEEVTPLVGAGVEGAEGEVQGQDETEGPVPSHSEPPAPPSNPTGADSNTANPSHPPVGVTQAPHTAPHLPGAVYTEPHVVIQGSTVTASSDTPLDMSHPVQTSSPRQARHTDYQGEGSPHHGATGGDTHPPHPHPHPPPHSSDSDEDHPDYPGGDYPGPLSLPGSPARVLGEGDADSIYHQPIKDVDRPSAARLAKRLYNLDGFKKNDIARHLSKKNDFAQLVGEEYLKYFDLEGHTLDSALRKFLTQLALLGETQERERILAHFSARFMLCNTGSFNSEDACHTLTCALMLLNSDLHGQNLGRKMSPNEFVENLADLNDGKNFDKEVLRNLYFSLKAEPLECEIEEDEKAGADEQHRFLGTNPFLDIPDPNKATEYRKGFVMRKCCVDPDGRKTPLGKRGWKMHYATLRDMVIYLHKDEHGFKKSALYNNMSNAIRIHHALATKATDYKKKQHVLRLQTCDWAQYLFQTSDSKECQDWMDTINFVAASLSAPPLPGGVGASKKFQRPLMPSSCTRLNLREQLHHHEQRVQQVERDMYSHRKSPPEKGAKSRVIQEYVEKEQFLQFELKRFKTYQFLLASKMASFPELEPSLVEVAIGEVDEPPSPPSGEASPPPSRSSTADRRAKPVQRSLSDRYSYRAAIYNRDPDLDL